MRINLRREHIPWVMAACRGVLGPVLIAGAACSWNGVTLAGIVVTALISDIYDGVLARRWGCDTAGVRLFDSMADTVFYLCTALALRIRLPQVWRSYAGLLVALLALELVRFTFDFVKFGKPASYHSYLAKAWGLVMAIAVVAAFVMQRGSVLVPVALGMGILCDLEGLAMSWVMPLWRKDVKTFGAALQLRGDLMRRGSQGRTHRWRERRRVIFTAFLGMVVSAVFVSSAFAVQDGQVAYAGGTVHVARGTMGSLDTTSPTALMFRYGSGGGQVEIPYTNISNFEYTSPVAHHLGVLPLIVVSLILPREHKHFFLIRYKDSSDVVQSVVFEVPKHDPLTLLEVLRGRAPQVCVVQKLRCGIGNEPY